MVVKPAKCDVARKEVEYLGNIVGNGKTNPDPRQHYKNTEPKIT